ncbi:family 1 glycosylhydrolase [Azospirillum sp.]|uniref:family 1 glycosylhydrolase n=1 Tax=Azospirillum sp. TaxID=34012 RepID=UPI002D5199A1|nr:family 1 glycosylhydrolase [Azospirillum sp.]HYD70874.1 family 1 glycosylhydrolase [Azospirillum sp.]
MPEIEVWGGIESTVARIGDDCVDQTVLSGHHERLDDLDAFARLNIHRIRYPVLWERVAPDGLESADWSWTDRRLERLRELGIKPIVGLLHHGSGPRATNLADPSFAERFTAFAARAAERYPWVEDWTPINEPLTTARFSGLYGLWYPHARDHRAFLCMLLNQIDGIRRAIRAIRAVNPQARLIQTEDICRVFSTPHLAYQAAYENERRWLSLDLLTGRVDAEHPLRPYLDEAALEAPHRRLLEELVEDPCPPDVIGGNHYLTSERFLDERLERYPPETHGGNGIDRYADVEAVRVVAEGVVGFEGLLLETWERYGLPVAATEVHNGSTREEQMRWLKEVWDGAVRLRARGVDVRAVTAWSLLGSVDWNSLLTRRDGVYESGVFDVRSPRPRPTALTGLLAALARDGDADHPVLDTPGWWHRPDRFFWPPVRCRPYTLPYGAWTLSARLGEPRTLLITGATGTLGRAFARHCALRGLPYRVLGRHELDISDPASVAAALDRHRPWALVNTAGYVRVDEAEAEPERCRRENTDGAVRLAEACAARGVALVTFSTDLVFDGAKRAPYVESDPVAPLGVYGASKAAAEAGVLSALPSALVVRTSAFFGPWDQHNFVTQTLNRLRAGQRVAAAADVVVSPTYVPDLVDATLDLLIDGEAGVWHLASAGAVSWADLARMAADRCGLDASRVDAVPAVRLGWTAPRPAYGVLGSERGFIMPALDDALARYAAARAPVAAQIGPAEGLAEYFRTHHAH